MYSRQKVVFAASLLVQMILCVGASASILSDDDVPEITARVARVTYVSGDVQIRRSGNTDWERVAMDLPVVEGDEVAAGADGRVEIQLDSFGHLRLDKNSILSVSTLKDEGVALSLPQGTLSVRLTQFDKDKAFLEIDAPKTTVAVQKAGFYRVDAGSAADKQVRVTATGSGEARVYSDNAGFTLKNGRSTTIDIEGDLAGEWETADASKYTDEFDTWSLDRDAIIATKLKDAYYDKYYDRDIYGAEDLGDYGEWIHTSDYGYVWRPYQNSISRYADWSPYRYGEWRWVPPFGWTWVNDEPWGWATYHHGRWFYDNGYWCWSPYGYYRNSRSWWSPALVVITIFDGNYCWYPLHYRSAYYDCNWYFHHGGNYHGHHNPNPVTAPSPGPVTGPGRMTGMPYYNVPVGGVVTSPGGSFGTGRGDVRKAPSEVAKAVLEKDPSDEKTMPRLPKFEDVSSKIGGRVKVEKPVILPGDKVASTGVIERKGSRPLDDELRITRVTDRRPPAQNRPADPATDKSGKAVRDTGAVGRPVTAPRNESEPVKSIPRERTTPSKESPSGVTPPSEAPRRSVEPRQSSPKDEPRYTPPPTRSVEPRNDPPKREEPRYTPPPKQDTPKSDPPKSDTPRSQPKEDSKPAPDSGRKKP